VTLNDSFKLRALELQIEALLCDVLLRLVYLAGSISPAWVSLRSSLAETSEQKPPQSKAISFHLPFFRISLTIMTSLSHNLPAQLLPPPARILLDM
jgi:hypothetical protein